jgi:cytochrome P450
MNLISIVLISQYFHKQINRTRDACIYEVWYCFILDGQTVRKGTNITIFIYGIHRDENVFPNSEKFDPERFADQNLITDERSPFAYIPFSAGSRNCIGKSISFMIINDFWRFLK